MAWSTTSWLKCSCRARAASGLLQVQKRCQLVSTRPHVHLSETSYPQCFKEAPVGTVPDKTWQ
eukprot:5375508-Pyramimonas_sp.AAC.1